MTDPYRIINVSPGTSRLKLRRAYRREKKRYKPIAFHDEQLKQLSQQRYDAIDNAYRDILARRRENPEQVAITEATPIRAYRAEFDEIRELIAQGSVDEADYQLRHLPITAQNAEWHFLMSEALCHRFYYIDGQRMLRRACELDPKNEEFSNKRKELTQKVQKYYKSGHRKTHEDCSESCAECGCLCCCEGGCEIFCEALGSC